MRHTAPILIACIIAHVPCWAVDFEQDIMPLFRERCLECHGPAEQSGDVRFDLRESAYKSALTPGKPDASLLLELVSLGTDDERKMPPDGDRLSKGDISKLRQWIAEGAKWPDHLAGRDARLDHWAWQAISNPPVDPESQEHPSIDSFIRRKLTDNALSPSPTADRQTLIRRLSFDLHGLPPSPRAVARFVNDTAPDAYSRLVDTMLGSVHFGERFAQHWLDIAHYADTHGFERDKRRDNAWRYRDYVIGAFNSDKPYDRFLQEQIAGDAWWPDDAEAVTATGFLAAGPWDFVGRSS